jgi:RNA polymerase sigma-70 factor (ECF subfamily)
VEGRPLAQRSDDALVERAQDRDVPAYTELVRRHQDAALRLAYVLCGSGLDVEDIAQESFVKAYLAIDRVRPDGSFRSWLLRIVANEASNRRRSAGRRAGYELRLATDRTSVEAAPSPEAAVLAVESQRGALAALAALPRRHREVVACRYLVGLSEAETAEVLGLPVGTVKSRTARALARLRDRLGGERDG